MEKEPLLKLCNVTRSYNEGSNAIEVLHGINLEIYKGEMVAIIGPSGSGKSTLMNIIGCLDTPTKGQYWVNGEDTKTLDSDNLAKLRRDFFGFIFQRYHLLGHLTACENVQIPAVYAGISHKKRVERALSLLDRLGLSHRSQHLPTELSGGQQQRVSIARALVNGGDIILADEPTGALDSHSGHEVMEILKDLNSKGHTIIIVTHDAKVASIAKRIITIEDGMITSDKENGAYDRKADHENKDEVKIDSSWAKSFGSYVDRWREAFNMALKAMVTNKLRTALTMLGIIIGIMAVVSVVALGRGASEQVLANISSLGTNTISIYPGKGMGDVHQGRVRTLNARDLKALEGQPYADSVSTSVESSVLLRYGNLDSDGSAYGVSENVFRVYGFTLETGRFFTENDIKNLAQVCVIDQNTKNTFFTNKNPIGQKILINKVPLTVIGVLNKVESPMMRPDKLSVYLPYTSMMSRVFNMNYLSTIIVRIKDNFSTAVAENSITSLLKMRHGRQDFFISSSDTIKKSIESATLTFTLLIGAIAVISLIVGGIGVMNIMLVSVTERTREIGIRMAVGARQSDIMSQFLIESLLVCLVGGALGVLFSFLLSYVVGYFVSGIVFSFSIDSIIWAVVTSSLIGITFGFMPSRAAARLNPIEALSRE